MQLIYAVLTAKPNPNLKAAVSTFFLLKMNKNQLLRKDVK